ncbi:MAG: phosphatase PAP2 family protein [Thermoplasmata archaeon]
MSWNHDLFRFINQDLANPALDVFFTAFIILGTIYVWLLFCPILWFKKWRSEAVDLFFLILVVLAVTTILKFVFAAPRPSDIRVVPLPLPGYFGYDIYSFPSNHASRAFACALFLSAKFRKWTVPLFVYAFLICFAKIYVGAHYPLDVIGGAIFGGVIGWVFLQLGRYPPYAVRREKLVSKLETFGRRLLGKTY